MIAIWLEVWPLNHAVFMWPTDLVCTSLFMDPGLVGAHELRLFYNIAVVLGGIY